MAQSAVSTVLGSVGNLAVRETTFLCGVTLEVGFLKDELMRLQAYLKDVDIKWRSGNARVAVLVGQIRTAAYEAQNVIEAADYMEKRNRLKKGFLGAISRYALLPSDLATLRKIGVEIQRVRRKLSEIFASADHLKIELDNIVVVEDEFLRDCSPMNENFEDDVVMVGFEDEHKEITNKLVRGERMLSAVSIVAMGGAGKTTVARKVCTSSRVKAHFDTIAWVTVSQKFKGIDLLNDIMKQITGHRYESVNEMQVGKKINEFLSRKRYLVVLDDVWEADTWEQINGIAKAFPDAANGSRVLLTTRKMDVANHVQMPTYVHVLKKLDEEKSWELFSSKALPSYIRHVIGDVGQFEELGRMLARKCDGLPLALAVLGGYLSKNMDTQAWSNVLLGWPFAKSIDMMRDILARSYKDLPSHYLRSCFLYVATFPEDYIIDVSVIIELWIAEGFIPHTPRHTLEETARTYVAELAQRSLVQVTSRSMSHEWIQKISVHDILRDWCIEEARQDSFLDVIDKISGQVGAASTNIMASHRSSYQDLHVQNLEATPNLRSLFCFHKSVSLPKLRFLRVLHIEHSSLQDFSKAIGQCIHLRYLRLRSCNGVTLPSSIGQLLYLQTIDMRRTNVAPVPTSMWDIPSLRHVYLENYFSPPRCVQQIELQTLWLDVRSGSWHLNMVRFLGQMTQVTTLLLKIPSKMPAEMMNILANMPHLVHVELYKLRAFDKLPESHYLPQSLRNFSLSADAIKQDPMMILEQLPCLVVLELEGYRGRTMSFSATGFPRLKYLRLKGCYDTEEWKIEAGAMPKLSHLILNIFPKMRKLPEGLLHLPSLNLLELENMPFIYAESDSTLKELQLKECEGRRGGGGGGRRTERRRRSPEKEEEVAGEEEEDREEERREEEEHREEERREEEEHREEERREEEVAGGGAPAVRRMSPEEEHLEEEEVAGEEEMEWRRM